MDWRCCFTIALLKKRSHYYKLQVTKPWLFLYTRLGPISTCKFIPESLFVIIIIMLQFPIRARPKPWFLGTRGVFRRKLVKGVFTSVIERTFLRMCDVTKSVVSWISCRLLLPRVSRNCFLVLLTRQPSMYIDDSHRRVNPSKETIQNDRCHPLFFSHSVALFLFEDVIS